MSDCFTSVQSFNKVILVPEEQSDLVTFVCNGRKGNTAALSQNFYRNRWSAYITVRGCRLRVTVLHAAMHFACHTLPACESDRVCEVLTVATDI